ncbi:NrfD/PsrC family molybdoenzyme membrane anchor subunit [Chloroflexota bacterium]
MLLKQQTIWGWKVALDLFLAATGAATFLLSFLFAYAGKLTEIAGLGTFVGTLLILVAAFFLVADLGAGAGDFASKIKARRMALLPNMRAWMLRGAIIVVLMLVFGLAYSIPTAFADSSPHIAIGIIAAVLSIAVILYTGFLLASSKGVPVWNTPMLPLLFLFSGLSTGIAIMVLISIATLNGVKLLETLQLLGFIVIPVICLILIMLGAYLETGSHGNEFVRESVRLLVKGRLAPLFWGILIVVGLIVPLILVATGAATLPVIGVINAVFLLLGGVYLRYLIIKSAIRTLALPATGGQVTVAGWTQVAK